MFTTRSTNRVRVPASPPPQGAADNPDRRTLLYLLSFLLAGFERIPSTRVPVTTGPAEWLDQWHDEEYVYLETRIPDDTSGLEIDLHVHDGVIFARIRRRGGDEAADPPQTFTNGVGPAVG
jgi:hypothetical protein